LLSANSFLRRNMNFAISGKVFISGVK